MVYDKEKTLRPITVDDLYNYTTVEDPQVSPDGQWVAFVRVKADKFSNSYKRHIWLLPTAGGEPLQITRGGKDNTPRWSPNSKQLAFVSTREDKPQIYLLNITAPGGEARALTSTLNGATSPAWSPDGTHIAYLSPMNAQERGDEDNGEEITPPQDELEGKQRKERRAHDEKLRLDPYPMWRVPYRVGTSYVGDRYAQIYVTPVAESDESKPRRLTDDDVNYAIPEWSGEYIYTARQIDPTQDEPFRQSAIYRIRVEDATLEQLTDDSHACFAPKPSPDGEMLAFIRFPRGIGSMSEHLTRLAVMPASGGEPRDFNLTLDQSVQGFDWLGDQIVFNSWTRGDGPVSRVDPQTGEIESLAGGTFKSVGVSAAPGGDVYFTASTPASPLEVFRYAADSNTYEAVTHFNREFLEEVQVQPHHEMVFTSPDGNEVQGWYILPADYEEGKTYPLALNIHGGPHQMWGPGESSLFHEWQLHAASGYVVFYCNPHGSDGYGEKFMSALHAGWGEIAYKDVMAGVDALLEKGFVDEQRMAVTGGSYGGYMTAWIIGQTDRFVSAVSQRGVYNLVSFYGTSDVPSLISGEFDVEPWEDHELLWKHSPLAYAHRMKTPLLLLHAENDFRVPIEQAEQLFAFVRRSGGTVEMLRYPRDGHELSRSGEPRHRVSRLTRMVAWFDKYCKP